MSKNQKKQPGAMDALNALFGVIFVLIFFLLVPILSLLEANAKGLMYFYAEDAAIGPFEYHAEPVYFICALLGNVLMVIFGACIMYAFIKEN